VSTPATPSPTAFPSKFPRVIGAPNVPARTAQNSGSVHHPARSGRLCQPSAGARYRFAVAANRNRLPHDDGCRRHRAHCLCDYARVDPIRRGPVADRFGKYRTVAIASVIAAVLVAVCGTVSSLPQLAVARLATGAVAAWVIPVSMAYVGDVTSADKLQPILARYASGYILGQLFGQAAGGVLGDLFGWRTVFFALAGMFAIAAFELIANPQTRRADHRAATRRGFMADYAAILSNPFARMILVVGFIEGALAWGAFAYIGANLHVRFDLSFTLVGLTVACFGIGGLIYSGLVRLLVYRLGQIWLTVIGGFVITAAYIVLTIQPVWWLAPIAVTAIGLGFYMFHNTLQTKATQMTPEARGTAVAIFSSALYFGQTAGVAAGALVIDRLGAAPLFLGTAVAFPALAIWFAHELRRRQPPI
jgi:predicted MFS family arabinose efflux permease